MKPTLKLVGAESISERAQRLRSEALAHADEAIRHALDALSEAAGDASEAALVSDHRPGVQRELELASAELSARVMRVKALMER